MDKEKFRANHISRTVERIKEQVSDYIWDEILDNPNVPMYVEGKLFDAELMLAGDDTVSRITEAVATDVEHFIKGQPQEPEEPGVSITRIEL
jgi:hypothetical protein